MSILETQLSTWANQGSVKMSSKTYESVKNCIDSINWKPDITYEIYLHKKPADNKKIGKSGIRLRRIRLKILVKSKFLLQLKFTIKNHSPQFSNH